MSKIIQTGNSLAVTIPKKFAQTMGLSKGDDVKIEKQPQNGLLILKFSGPRQLVITSQVLKTRVVSKYKSKRSDDSLPAEALAKAGP